MKIKESSVKDMEQEEGEEVYSIEVVATVSK